MGSITRIALHNPIQMPYSRGADPSHPLSELIPSRRRRRRRKLSIWITCPREYHLRTVVTAIDMKTNVRCVRNRQCWLWVPSRRMEWMAGDRKGIQFGTYERGNKSPINSVQFIERSISTWNVLLLSKGEGEVNYSGIYSSLLEASGHWRRSRTKCNIIYCVCQWVRMVVFQLSHMFKIYIY